MIYDYKSQSRALIAIQLSLDLSQIAMNPYRAIRIVICQLKCFSELSLVYAVNRFTAGYIYLQYLPSIIAYLRLE
jgi:hypothetical protein